jgi:RND family efflux transporter MFP subunit
MVNRVLVPVALLLLAACGSDISTDRGAVPDLAAAEVVRSQDSLPPAASPAEVVMRVPALQPVELTTVLYSEHDVELTARKRGVVAAVSVELGDQVQTGQELGRLDDGEEKAAFDAASAARDLAKAEHDRIGELARQNVAAAAQLEQATFRLRAADAALADATVRLEYTRIRAPFAGAVTRRFIRTGQTVDEGDPLFRTTALRPLRALLRVPELQAAGLATGDAVKLHGLSGALVRGRIRRISPAVDPASGTVEVLVDVADPGRLRPGSAVRAELTTRSQ